MKCKANIPEIRTDVCSCSCTKPQSVNQPLESHIWGAHTSSVFDVVRIAVFLQFIYHRSESRKELYDGVPLETDGPKHALLPSVQDYSNSILWETVFVLR
jgi:hypothetical protein